MRSPSQYMSDFFINDIWPVYASRLTNKRTKENYFNIVCAFCDYIENDFLDVTVSQAKDYFDSIQKYIPNKKKISNNTIQCRLSTLRSLSSFIVENKDKLKIPDEYINVFLYIDVPEVDEYIRKEDIPSIKELNKLLQVVSDDNNLMMHLILAMVIRCAFTASEICKMRVSQIIEDSDNRIAVVFKEKDKERFVKLPEDVVTLLLNYRKQIPLSADHMFYNKKNFVLKVRNLESLVRKYVKMAGLSKEFTIQDIRKAAVCYMKASGADDVSISKMIGVEGRWMYRYDRVIEELDLQPVDLAKIRIIH